MNIFSKVALQSMKKSRTRTIVTVVGVALSAAMITAVASFAVSLQSYMVNGAIAKYGGWQVEFLDVPSPFVQERDHDEGVSSTASYENIGYAALKGGKNPYKPYLFIAGFSKEAFDTVPLTLLSGRLPENSGEILVPAHVAANGGVTFSVGDTLSLPVGSRMDGGKRLGQHDPYRVGSQTGKAEEALVEETEKTYTIVGICQRPKFEELSAPGYTLITTMDPADRGDSFGLFVTLQNPRQVHAYASGKSEGHPYIFNDDVLRFMGLSDDTMFNALLYAVGGVLALLIITGSVFLIYNSFSISLNERTRQFGILSSVGATAKQLRNSVLFEGLCIGAAGIPLGILAGICSIGFVIKFVAEKFGSTFYSAVPLTLKVSFPAIAAAAAVSLVTILISAYIPARKAANTPVMESIRQTKEIKAGPRDVKTSAFAQRLYGLPGTLALKNFKRNKRRYRSIVLSLTLSILLFVSASTFGTHLNQAAERAVVESDYDICVCTQGQNEDQLFQLYDKLQAADGVYKSSYQAMLAYTCAVKADDFSKGSQESGGYELSDEGFNLPMDIQFIPDNEYLDFIKSLGLPAEQYTGQSGNMIAVAKAKSSDGTKEGKGELIDMFTNRSMNVTLTPQVNDGEKKEQGKNVTLTFIDTIPNDTLPRNTSATKAYTFMAVAPYDLKEKFETPGVQAEMGLTFLSKNPAQSADEMEAMIHSAGNTSDYTLYNVHKMLEDNRNIVFIVDVFTYVFVLMISLIATANVFNTISTNIKLRRRELSMLRSVGMSNRDFKRMMNFECAFYGMRTLLGGLPIAGIVSWLIYKGLVAGGADIDFMFPWGSMGISVIGVFLVVFLTMLYAVGKIKKENIIDALRDDMT